MKVKAGEVEIELSYSDLEDWERELTEIIKTSLPIEIQAKVAARLVILATTGMRPEDMQVGKMSVTYQQAVAAIIKDLVIGLKNNDLLEEDLIISRKMLKIKNSKKGKSPSSLVN